TVPRSEGRPRARSARRRPGRTPCHPPDTSGAHRAAGHPRGSSATGRDTGSTRTPHTRRASRRRPSRSHVEFDVAPRLLSLLEQNPLNALVEVPSVVASLAHGRQPDPAEFGEAADHVKDDASLPDLLELEPV